MRKIELDGDRIIACRKAMALTCEEFARAIGVHQTTIYKWEADGYFRGHSASSARVVEWLITLTPEEMKRVAKMIRHEFESGDGCAIRLFAEMGLPREAAEEARGKRAT